VLDDWPMVRGGPRSASTYDSHEIEAETKGLATSACLRQGRRSEASSDLSVGMATTASVPGSVTVPIIDNVTLSAARWVRSADRPWGLCGLGVLVAPACFGDR
jgi:hypothetical protein